jgi:hypothetical protein
MNNEAVRDLLLTIGKLETALELLKQTKCPKTFIKKPHSAKKCKWCIKRAELTQGEQDE